MVAEHGADGVGMGCPLFGGQVGVCKCSQLQSMLTPSSS